VYDQHASRTRSSQLEAALEVGHDLVSLQQY
jgi:hypothetical protein